MFFSFCSFTAAKKINKTKFQLLSDDSNKKERKMKVGKNVEARERENGREEKD